MTIKMYLQLSCSHHTLFKYLGGTQSLSPYITETQKNYQQAHSRDLQGLLKSHILEDIGTWTPALCLCVKTSNNTTHKNYILRVYRQFIISCKSQVFTCYRTEICCHTTTNFKDFNRSLYAA